ncbi:MAG: phosphoribosylamine--glycine ligase, partial [Limnochordia bacterium]
MAGDKRVLIVGGGGREHALATALKKSPQVGEIFCSPGNAGIASMATCVDINDGVQGLARWAEENRIDLTVVGPEAELAVGIADIFAARGLTLFGPSRAAAALETSKVFAKEFMARHGIPTAAYQVFSDYGQALDYLARQSFPLVIKADGLAAGKGVTVADNLEEAQGALEAMMVEGIFGEAGSQVVIEEFLPGEEATLLVFTDGEQILPMPSAQDHKRIGEGDTGPNTGGMGAYSPTRVLTPSLEEKVMETIVRPTIEGMAREGRPY